MGRYAYSPFGDAMFLDADMNSSVSSAFNNSCLFSGRELDLRTEFNDFRYRHSISLLGSFLIPDPSGYSDGPNLYTMHFVPNSIDPLGLRGGWGAWGISDYWAPWDPRPPLTNTSPTIYCEVLASLIRDRLNTPEEKEGWDHFTSGVGTPTTIPTDVFKKVMDNNLAFRRFINDTAIECSCAEQVKPSKKSAGFDVGNPYVLYVGRAAFKFDFQCRGECLDWTATIHDLFDFDIRGIPFYGLTGGRTVSAEFKTWLVNGAHNIPSCNWKSFYVNGSASGTLCKPLLDPVVPPRLQ